MLSFAFLISSSECYVLQVYLAYARLHLIWLCVFLPFFSFITYTQPSHHTTKPRHHTATHTHTPPTTTIIIHTNKQTNKHSYTTLFVHEHKWWNDHNGLNVDVFEMMMQIDWRKRLFNNGQHLWGFQKSFSTKKPSHFN